MKIHSVIGGGGVKLHVREWGKVDAPSILFIHGWSQNYLCWRKQYESQLADAFPCGQKNETAERICSL